MRNYNGILRLFLFLIFIFCAASYGYTQERDSVTVPRGILFGDGWSTETRELMTVFSDQSSLDLGESGIRTVQIWTDIRNAAGKNITWVVEYANGMRQEVLTQQIRYNRFRTYIIKTFRRKLWDPSAKQLVDVTGACKVMLVDKQDKNKIIATKKFILK